MNKYTKPELKIVCFEPINIIATSVDFTGELQTYGQNVNSVNAADVTDIFG